ncbi:nucleoside hydrolase [Candidatus Gottesmanbacteria bacterium]|nr:nucleoside hydrolase [Candidatus Gottesmanbacteria bacterium]
MRKKIIIDTDPGHDDALAIMLLAKSGTVDIEAITTVAGNATIAEVTNNARFIADLIGLNVPIFSGAEKPLARPLIQAVVHGSGGLAGVTVTKKEKLTGNAAEKIIEIVRKNPGEISLVVIGPETNIAKAFLKDPIVPTLVKQLVIMGGTIEAPGNKNRVGEFNIFVDPEAAKVVFDAPVRKILVPLDQCNNIPLFMEDFRKLKGSPLYRPIIFMMREFIKGISQFENTKGALVYDALAAYFMVNPKAVTLKSMDLRIETKGELTRGMTVADRRNWGQKNPNVDVVVGIDRSAFIRDFISLLSK